MKRLFVKCFLFALLLMIADLALGPVLSKWVQSRASDRRVGEIFTGQMQYDALVFGSSRAARNIVAAQIEEQIGLTSYSLGLPGSNIDFHAQLLDFVVNSGQAPKLVLLAVDPTELIADASINFRFDVLYPYAGIEEVRKVLSGREQLNDGLSRLSAVYREKHGVLEAFRPHKLLSSGVDPLNNIYPDGSMPIDGKSITYEKMSYGKKKVVYSKARESAYLRERFAHFIKTCAQYKIQLVVVISPAFGEPIQGFYQRMIDVAGDGVVYLDYSRHPQFKEKKLYYDSIHLNKEGGYLLSKQMGQDLNALLHDPKKRTERQSHWRSDATPRE